MTIRESFDGAAWGSSTAVGAKLIGMKVSFTTIMLSISWAQVIDISVTAAIGAAVGLIITFFGKMLLNKIFKQK